MKRTPWRVVNGYVLEDSEGTPMATTNPNATKGPRITYPTARNTAHQIARAVNSYPALLAALKALRDGAMNTPDLDSSEEWTALIEQADAAIAQAEEVTA